MSARHSHQALFPHGLNPGAKLLVCLLVSIVLLTVDTRYDGLALMRSGFFSLLVPVEQGLEWPWLTYRKMDAFFVRQATLLQQNRQLSEASLAAGTERQRNRELERENRTLRALLGLLARLRSVTTSAEIVGIPRDPWHRLFTVDAGSLKGIQAGSAVIDAQGLLGQITRTWPGGSEVTLLTDKDQAVPVTITRTGTHAIVFGTGAENQLELRYLPHNTDVRPGDLLVTSGLDGLYPPDLPVARVLRVDTTTDQEFDLINCRPVAAVDRDRQVLIIHPEAAR